MGGRSASVKNLGYERVDDSASYLLYVSTPPQELTASFGPKFGRIDQVTGVMAKQLDEFRREMAALSTRIVVGQSNMEFALDDLREILVEELDRLRKTFESAGAPEPEQGAAARDMTETIRALEAAVHDRDRIIAALRSSSSWRITRPLRLVCRLAREPRRTTRDVAVLTLRWALTKLMLRRPGMVLATQPPDVVEDGVKQVTIIALPDVSMTRGTLSPNARAVYDKLKHAIAKDNR